MAAPTATQDDDFDFFYKIVLIGDQGVGKSHLLSRYIKNSLPKHPTATVGVEFATSPVVLANGKIVKAQIWDTAGQERYRAITRAHYRRALGGLVVYDVTDARSFSNCKRWIQELRTSADPDVVVILVGNKIDLVESSSSSRAVSAEEARAFASENGCLFEETSAVSAVNVTSSFQHLMQSIYDKRASKAGTKEKSPTGVNLAAAGAAKKSTGCNC
eukprot:GILI01008316.1.p1 GENE.GILI01008316.1~~GILI01008316.1.p1  ORF type:complete len:227 (-),score=60.81 GILI01008316.1:289-936(-)